MPPILHPINSNRLVRVAVVNLALVNVHPVLLAKFVVMEGLQALILIQEVLVALAEARQALEVVLILEVLRVPEVVDQVLAPQALATAAALQGLVVVVLRVPHLVEALAAEAALLQGLDLVVVVLRVPHLAVKEAKNVCCNLVGEKVMVLETANQHLHL